MAERWNVGKGFRSAEESETYRKTLVESEKRIETIGQRHYYIAQMKRRELNRQLVIKIVLFLIGIILMPWGYSMYEQNPLLSLLLTLVGGIITIYCLATWREYIDRKRRLDMYMAQLLDTIESSQEGRVFGENEWKKAVEEQEKREKAKK